MPVFPVAVTWNEARQKYDKRPMCVGGFLAATLDPDQITRWWAQFPNASIGGVPGRAGYVCSIPTMATTPLTSPTCRRPSPLKRSVAAVTYISQRMRNSAIARWAPKIDTRCASGYVVLPPSPGYTVVDNREPAAFPHWAVERLRKATAPAEPQEQVDPIRLRHALARVDPNRYPGYDEWAGMLAAIAGAGGDAELALEWSSGRLGHWPCPDNYCGDDFDMDAKLASFARVDGPKAGFGTICMPLTLPKSPPPAASANAGRDDPAARFGGANGAEIPIETPPPRKSRVNLLTEDDLFAMPDPEELVAGFIMQNENVCLYSEPKAGKTFVALDICLSLAAGLPVFGKLPVLRPNTPVVYLSAEGHAGMKRRIKAWRQARGIPNDRKLPFYYNVDVPEAERGAQEVKDFVNGIRAKLGTEPALVVIDTMARSLGGLDENTNTAAAAYLAITGALVQELKTTTLTLAHQGKTQPGKANNGIRGSSAFTGGFDAIWHLQKNADTGTAMLVAVALKDAENLGPHCFRVEPVTVVGMKNGQGAVLRHITRDEYTKTAEQMSRKKLLCKVVVAAVYATRLVQ